ncbi:hypothetical protein [Paraburkholderia caballeronis]|uniref:Uncharacterized protein n=1 Tax=Paraburkholderia caballeronis TaxID=416943 RepID=A0A1H7TY45_9BURK|nr:hypothetical protein [Paraburkholderia caballeronis]PXW23375.1 hypothetical protein C7403_110113 [Paraburkholderia caballeronis]PXW98368.1 hypothetical protein C7407_110113 [Paraburkholderia caballeronis]RAJ95098.1 hypothetical protein C7409_110113 [Paraburkholderia caballeronis]SEC57265.1 hypothetical protein SAMN05445871_2447 [Paraburkholderia caballeronis]SEL89378.1 hypothetical protein SAMN05192542_1173 [Paraburkholderia caballeronis]
MTTQDAIWKALTRLEHADLSSVDRELLRPAFAAMHGAQAIRIPDRVVARIRHLDATQPRE